MTNKQCVDYLENICKMFVNGSKNCEGQALEYQQEYISAIRYAIAILQGGEEYFAYRTAYFNGVKDGRATAKPQGECKACDYYKFAQSFINGIVEVISKNGLTSIDELLEILKREANKNG